MSDLISRKDLIDWLTSGIIRLKGIYGDLGGAVSGVREMVKVMPSVEPEQKKGKWQRRKGSDCWECSECHAVLEDFDIKLHNYYFCYHCGTNMMTMDGWMNIEEVKHE